MLTQLHLKNFRSIEGQTIALAPITVLYGATSSGKASAEIHQGFSDMELTGKVPMPYALNQNFQTAYKGQTGEFNVNWNGVTCSAVPTTPTAQTQEEATRIASETNSIIEAVKAID